MISLQPIHKKIRETLHNKSRAVSRDFSGTKNSPELDPVDTIRETYAKTTWVKMFSPVDNTKDGGLDTVSIVNGILDKKGVDKNQSMFSGFDSLYRQGEKGGGPLAPKTGIEGEVKTHRPIPGIKDVTIDYKGGLSAIRTATINWTCWTFQDVEVLQPHFMAHGNGVLLEWGWSEDVPGKEKPLLLNEQDMIDGTAYYLIQDKVIANAGNYDAMAGIISDWEWSVRDDGGFDCTTTLVSRGVNILEGDSAAPGTKVVDEDGKIQPPLKIFVGGLKETLYDLTAGGETFWDGANHKALTAWNGDWENGKDAQPPGVFTWTTENLFGDMSGGPWVTWGFLEDNILSRFAGLVAGDNGRPISSFRSIEPILTGNDGQYEGQDGNPTDNPFQAKFQSVIIRNSEWLLTPSFNRWILPGQFPAGNIATDGGLPEALDDYGDFIMEAHAAAFKTDDIFRKFAVTDNPNDGGYLRNILISYDLIEDAFRDATTIKEGMSNLFDEFNKDLNGYWNFNLVSDIHNPGNIKVIDTNKTHVTVSQLITERDTKKNPDSKLFMFPSWGEKSIVKSQTMNSKIPSSMAVSAMYAQTSDEKHEDAASPEGKAVAGVAASRTAKDKSQDMMKFAKRIGTKKPYGSISPYGDLEDGKFSSDEKKKTAIPNGAKFGNDHGVAFDLDFEKLMFYYMEASNALDKETKEKSEEEEKAAKAAEKQKKLIASTQANKLLVKQNFETMMENKNEAISFDKDGWWDTLTLAQSSFTLYDRDGNLTESFAYNVLPGHTMLEYIHGTTLPIDPESAKKSPKIDMPIPIELEITIDGTGGIIPGNPFQVDYIPQRYNKYTVFQALTVGHSIDSSNWTTTIKGQMRVAMDKIK